MTGCRAHIDAPCLADLPDAANVTHRSKEQQLCCSLPPCRHSPMQATSRASYISAAHAVRNAAPLATMKCYRLRTSACCMRGYDDAVSWQLTRSVKAGQVKRGEVMHVNRIPMVLFQGLR